MKNVFLLLSLLIVVACGGSAAPAFAPSSPACPDAPPAPRHSVAAVLATADPLAATVCAPDKPYAAQQAQTNAPPPSEGQDNEHTHHHHHGGGNTP